MMLDLKPALAGHCDLVYFLSSLPPLPKPGDVSPISCMDMLNYLSDAKRESELLKRVFLGEDILLYQEYQSGYARGQSSIVLTEGQLNNQEPLPYGLPGLSKEGRHQAENDNDLWQAYFQSVAQGGQDYGCRILCEWVIFEVGLRNALAGERGRLLGREPTLCVIDFPNEPAMDEYAEIVEKFHNAVDPLEAACMIELERWDWLDRHEFRYEFDIDELAAYALRLTILHRYSNHD